MNEVVEKYWPRALKLVRQYETEEWAFADLTGFVEEFAEQYASHVNQLPESQRALSNSALEAEIKTAMRSASADSKTSQALSELLISINRCPIY